MIFILPSWDRIKVNGRDLNDVTAEEAMDLFQGTNERLTLEVLRNMPAIPKTYDIATQTEAHWWEGEGEEERSDCKHFLDSLYQNYLLPEEHSSDDEDYLPIMPHDVENADELPCQVEGSVFDPEQDIASCFVPDRVSFSAILTENDEDSIKTAKSSASHPDWDSGLGCTDGSIRVDENSGLETESDDPCVQEKGCLDPETHGPQTGTPLHSVDFSTSDDLSDSGFCSISPEEYMRFQKILEGRCQQYQLCESRQEQKAHQILRHKGLENHVKPCDEGLERSSWSPGLPTLEEYPEGMLTVTHSKNAEHCLNSSLVPCPKESMTSDYEKNKKDKSKSNRPIQSPATSIHSGEKPLDLTDRGLRCCSYLNLVREEQMDEWCAYPITEPNPARLHNVSCHNQTRQQGRLQCERNRVLCKKQQKIQLMKERALRLKEERSGATTDDDAQSEIKMGRHWSKAERRQHLQMAKEQKQRKELLLQCRMESLAEGSRAGTDNNSNEHNIIELSHKKLMRKRSKKVLDNWITIQELLSHGAKSIGGTTLYSPLLSVTTV
ncbi:hypothetical protein NDU88_004512 [Pleurodeles waltl]|uniref:Uncharacterized protein n=1 Tax=Pleurodeles waltl TaxID=8319 RepID=A0AAV7QCJ9_PLEWA|nr:hypothetical protein NDU88_004512 [Pleurodeles waltl]